MRRALVGVAIALALCCSLGASVASAETVTLGNSLTASEVNLGICAGNACTVSQFSESNALVDSPVDGSVVSWKYRSSDEGAKYELEVLRPTGGAEIYEVGGRSPAVTVPDNEDTVKSVTLATPLAIKKGDFIGLHLISGAGVPVSPSSNPETGIYEFFPDVGGASSSSGSQELMRYSFKAQPGMSVKFVEGVDRGASAIGAARGARGAIRFSPSLGSGAQRTIIAEIIREGRLAASTVVARYSPGTIRPGRPSKIRVRHLHGGWIISFRPGANTTEHQLTIRFADGAQVLLDAPRGRHSVGISTRIDRTRPTAVQVVGLRGAAHGPAAKLIARTARRRHR
ncbi:MAG: hypothetical protein ACYDHN_16630 [Solirubrobacteraceae bacterium]